MNLLPRSLPCVIGLMLLFTQTSVNLFAQFTDVTDDYGLAIYHNITVSESGVSFHDFDRDGLDDLTYASSGYGVFTFRNTGEGFEQVYYFPFIDGKTLHPIWVDYDNDGDADFFATRAWQCPVLFQNQGNQTFIDMSNSLPCPAEGIVSTCATWGDYDNNGWLDVYVSNYNPLEETGSPNWLFHNHGDGSFTEVGQDLGVAYGNYPAYQSMFLDVDFDRDQDLLVVNDKYDGCLFFRNEGEHFIEIGEENGFDVHIEAMSLSVSDFDHDGDYDFYISNTIEGNVFLVNQNGIFTDMSAELGTMVNANCWGSVFIDSELKSWEDLYVVSTGPIEGVNVMLKNAQGSVFFEQYDSFNFDDTEYSYAIAKGDANNDGAYDIMSMPYFANGSLLFQSSAPPSTFVKITPQGTISNRDGVGATIRLFTGAIQQIRPVTCGENFTSQDSRSIIFGTNSSPVDSIIIEWPSGWTDTWYNLELNSSYTLTEGANYTTQDTIFNSLCNNESILLNAGSGSSFLWDDGSENPTREVNQIGEYQVSISNEFGLTRHVYFIVSSSAQSTEVQITHASCHSANGAIHLILPDATSVIWGNGTTGSSLLNIPAGTYSYILTDTNNCSFEASEEIQNIMPWTYQIFTDTACFNHFGEYSIELISETQFPQLMGLPGWEGQLPPGVYSFTLQDTSGCIVDDNLTVHEHNEITIHSSYEVFCNEENHHAFMIHSHALGGTPPYVSNITLPFTTETLNVPMIIWEDATGCEDSSLIEIPEVTQLQLMWEIFTDDDMIFAHAIVSGGIPPYSYIWNNVPGNSYHPLNNNNEIEVMATDSAGCSVVSDTSLILSALLNPDEVLSPICQTEVFDTFGRLCYSFSSPLTVIEQRALLPRGLWLMHRCGTLEFIAIE